MRRNIYYQYLSLTVGVLMLINCAKRSVTPPGTPLAQAAAAKPSLAPPSLPESRAREANRVVVQKAGAQKTAARGTKQGAQAARDTKQGAQGEAPRADTITMNVFVEGGGEASRTDLGATVRDALNAVATTDLVFECPVQMRAGSTEQVRLTTRRNLNDQFRNQLQARGIPASQTMAAVILVSAVLTSSDSHAFDIGADEFPDRGSSNERVWRVEARNPGHQELDMKVTLSARLAPAGEVQADPVTFSQAVSVVGSENFFYQYWPQILGCGASLLCAWMAFTFWHSRRTSVFSSR
jgi:hypothetical protein